VQRLSAAVDLVRGIDDIEQIAVRANGLRYAKDEKPSPVEREVKDR